MLYPNLIRHYFTHEYLIRVKKFLIVGTSAAALNLSCMYVFVQVWGFESNIQQNIANFLSMETSVIYNFLLSRIFTWKDAKKFIGGKLVMQLLAFHIAVALGMLIRIIMFPVLDSLDVHYLINVTVGIGVAAIIDFFMYDSLIFRREKR